MAASERTVWIVTLAEYRWDRGEPIRAFETEAGMLAWVVSAEATSLHEARGPYAGFDWAEVPLIDTHPASHAATAE